MISPLNDPCERYKRGHSDTIHRLNCCIRCQRGIPDHYFDNIYENNTINIDLLKIFKFIIAIMIVIIFFKVI